MLSGCWPRKQGEDAARTSSTKDQDHAPVVFVTPAMGAHGGEALVVGTPGRDVRWFSVGPEGEREALAESGRRASSLAPGAYAVEVDGQPPVHVEVSESLQPTVRGYRTVGASGETARDGEVVVDLNIPDNCDFRIAWSNGAFTKTKHLRNVRPGEYVATLLEISGHPVPCIHASLPARVGVVERT